MSGQCGCGLSSLGNRVRKIVLDNSGPWAAGRPVTIYLNNAQSGIPKGLWRYLDYIDITVTANVTVAGGGSITTPGFFDGAFQQIVQGHDIWGQLYGSGVTFREVRLLYWYLNGQLADVDPAPMAPGGPTTVTYTVRVFYTVDGLQKPRDLAMPIHTLPNNLQLTCGTAALMGTGVTINTLTFEAVAWVHDSADMIMPDAWMVQSTRKTAASLDLPGGDYLRALVDEITGGVGIETISAAEWTSHTVLGYDPVTSSYNANVIGANANYMRPGDRLTLGAAEFMPLIDLPGPVGKQSVRETHGSDVTVTVRRDGGTMTDVTIVSLVRTPRSPDATKSAFQSAYPGVRKVHRKTAAKTRMSIAAGNGIPIKASPMFAATAAAPIP
jgi:hypothetical protein